ncbi:MAG: A/G-specific adenine glycosylase [Pseudomonadota bacterium]
MKPTATFAQRLIAWQKNHGRHDLPWQVRDPYRVWLSEVMLQQTQVATVLPYYQRFLVRFPSLTDLARARQDELMPYWAGLGYYARARNLHKAAQLIAQRGFPTDQQGLMALPGIGRSTAAAIAVFCFEARAAICDGNVKRVLARHQACAEAVNTVQGERVWYSKAEALLPKQDLVAYTQGLMDLGATLCTRTRPRCSQCPVQSDCAAYASKRVAEFPVKQARLKIQTLDLHFALLRQDEKLALVTRPQTGIWAGLHCLPEYRQEHQQARVSYSHPVFQHRLTHRLLHIHVHEVAADRHSLDGPGMVFFPRAELHTLALPTPIKTFLQNLNLQ